MSPLGFAASFFAGAVVSPLLLGGTFAWWLWRRRSDRTRLDQ